MPPKSNCPIMPLQGPRPKGGRARRFGAAHNWPQSKAVARPTPSAADHKGVATIARRSLSSRLPLLQQELWAHTKVPHRAHMVGAHQHGPNSQQGCAICHVLDTHGHAFMHCPMAAYVWHALLKWAKQVQEAEKLSPPLNTLSGSMHARHGAIRQTQMPT